MSELVERIARAIYDNKPGPDGPEIFKDEPWRSCIPAARAAIEAMREPTEAMANEGAYLVPGDESTWRDVPAATCARQIWSEMIDAALTGDTK